jgi:hypothetical protein
MRPTTGWWGSWQPGGARDEWLPGERNRMISIRFRRRGNRVREPSLGGFVIQSPARRKTRETLLDPNPKELFIRWR